jgi:hypothetical protein
MKEFQISNQWFISTFHLFDRRDPTMYHVFVSNLEENKDEFGRRMYLLEEFSFTVEYETYARLRSF